MNPGQLAHLPNSLRPHVYLLEPLDSEGGDGVERVRVMPLRATRPGPQFALATAPDRE